MNSRKHGAVLIAAGCSCALVFSGCSGDGSVDRGGPSGEVAFAEVSAFPDNLFPIIAAGLSISVANILIRILPATFRVLPDFTVAYDSELLTEEPTLTEVDGKQVNVYSINQDAVWSDGTPISAADFAFTAKVQDSEFVEACPNSGVVSTVGYDQIESIEGSEDDRTVTITYATRFADWKSLFSPSSPLLPAHLLDSEDPVALCETITTGWPVAQGIPEEISGGPWQLERNKIDVTSQVITLTPNEQYWGQQPHLAALVHQAIGTDPNAALSGIENGEVQLLYTAPQLDLVDQIAAFAPEVVSVVQFALAFEHLDLNTLNPHLADANVRRAFGLALDRQEIIDQTVGQFSPDSEVLNNRIYLNTQPEYQDTAPSQYNTPDVSGAQALLEESGYALAADGIYVHPERGRLSLVISTTTRNRLRAQILDVIVPQARAAGFEITPRVDESLFSDATFPTSLEAGGFDIALFSWIGSPFQSSSAGIYRSPEASGGLAQNYTRGGNPEVDALYEEFLREPDLGAQAELGNRIDALLWEDLYTIPLYQQPVFLAYSANLEGVELNGSQAGPLWNSETWTLTE